MTTSVSCASIADAAGNLLFYTDGSTIWNNLNNVMLNGTGILSGKGTQCVLIAKQPGSNSIYYIFVSTDNGLHYSIVDISLAGGLGGVTLKNTFLTVIPQINKVTGTYYCNRTDLWILSQDQSTNVTRAYLLTSSGLNASPVISAIGSVNYGGFETGLKFSPDGRKLASSNVSGHFWQLYSFNAATGLIACAIQVSTPSQYYPGDIEFSPDGIKLYVRSAGINQVWQYDLSSGSAGGITASFFSGVSQGYYYYKRSLVLGPDGKIYIAQPSYHELAVINNPNVAGAGCNFVQAGQTLGIKRSEANLPNFIKPFSFSPAFTHTINLTSCQTVSFKTPQNANINCQSFSTTINWDFGDPASGTANTSSFPNPTHTYPGPGTYTCQLVSSYNCGSDTTIQIITILNTPPVLSITGTSTLCPGKTTTLTVSGASGYKWSTPSGGTSSGSIIVITPTLPGTNAYTVIGTSASGCTNTITALVTAYPQPTLTVSGNNFVCASTSTTLTVNGANSYTWSTGANTNTLLLNPTTNTTYSVSGTNLNGCENSSTVLVSVKPFPSVSINNPTSCVNNPVVLLVNTIPISGITFTWLAGGSNSPSISVNPTATSVYSVIADLNGCSITKSATVTLTELSVPVTNFHYTTPICHNAENPSPIHAINFNNGGNYFSTEGLSVNASSGIIDLANSGPGAYTVNYSLQQINCTAANSGTTSFVILKPPALHLNSYILIAPGTNTILSVSGGLSYTWTPDLWLSCVNCSTPLASPHESTQYCVRSEENGCINQVCVQIDVTCDANHDFSVPNAFTPNGDNLNDEFCLSGWDFCVWDFSVMIFDRWGEKIYESSKSNFCWNGIYKGQLLSSDTFIYVINATYSDNKKITKKGNINLIR